MSLERIALIVSFILLAICFFLAAQLMQALSFVLKQFDVYFNYTFTPLDKLFLAAVPYLSYRFYEKAKPSRKKWLRGIATIYGSILLVFVLAIGYLLLNFQTDSVFIPDQYHFIAEPFAYFTSFIILLGIAISYYFIAKKVKTGL